MERKSDGGGPEYTGCRCGGFYPGFRRKKPVMPPRLLPLLLLLAAAAAVVPASAFVKSGGGGARTNLPSENDAGKTVPPPDGGRCIPADSGLEASEAKYFFYGEHAVPLRIFSTNRVTHMVTSTILQVIWLVK